MALTRDFKQTVLERAKSDPDFRIGLLTEAYESLLNDEPEVTKSLLRDYVNATIGFQELGNKVNKKPASLMRMLSEKGNPSLNNMTRLLAVVRKYEGVEFKVHASRE